MANWRKKRTKTRLIVLHHTAGSGENRSYLRMLVDEALRRHESYAKVVLDDPVEVKQLYPDDVCTNHSGSAQVNMESIGIAYEGNTMRRKPSDKAINELVWICTVLCDRYGLDPSAIVGHRDIVPTACPGDELYALIPEIRRRVGRNLEKTHGRI